MSRYSRSKFLSAPPVRKKGMKKEDLESKLLIDDFSPLLNAVKNGQIKIVNQQKMEQEDSGVDYAAEYRKQTGKDLETGEYVTQ